LRKRKQKPEEIMSRVRLAISVAGGRNARWVAEWLQKNGLDIEGSVVDQVGFGTWGVEEGVTITTLTNNLPAAQHVVELLLGDLEQECAYVEVLTLGGGFAAEEWRRTDDGLRVANIAGHRGDPDDLEPEK
jgi:hypothetical protein